MCDKAIWLNSGTVVMQGDIDEVCDEYTATIEQRKAEEKKRKAQNEKLLKDAADAIAAQKRRKKS